MKQYIHLTNSRGETRYSTLPQDCINCANKCSVASQLIICEFDKQQKRQGKVESEIGGAYLCTNEKDLVNSKKLFRAKLEFYLSLIPEIRNIRESIRSEVNKETKRLIHNLTSLNAHNIQEIYSLVPQEALTKNIRKQVTTVKSYIDHNTTEVAAAFLRIAKNNVSIKNEFSVFKKLYEITPRLNKNSHPIHKVVLNVLHLFFNEFTANHIEVVVSPNTEKVYLDYESMHVALYHIIENATKYVCPGSNFQVNFRKTIGQLILIFDMVSLRIEDEDMDRIYEEGYSGINAITAEKAGHGIGMTIVMKVLQLNGATLQIKRNTYPSMARTIDGVYYENNCFEISLPLK